MFTKVLIANRGEIACRVIRTLKKMGIASVAVYSDADVAARHVSLADEAVHIGPAPAAQSYLVTEKILAAAKDTGAQAIHPGYGFLSENADFADACAQAGIAFIGPTPAQMRAFGLKHTARALAHENNVPLLPGSGLLRDVDHAGVEAARIGFPVMLKSTAGGGGIGMRLCTTAQALAEAFASVQRLASANFKDAGIYLEKYVEQARHIEVQIFGDGKGTVIALGERDCSVQRRNQKVIEETPAPGLTAAQRQRLHETAVRLGRAVAYESAGTVEFVCDAASGEFYFLEVNTRLQVEHGVTEEVTGIDLVEWMVRQAAGELSLAGVDIPAHGVSIQVRLYAEDPAKNFQPCTGTLTEVAFPDDVRIDTWIERGTEVSSFYDPLLAKPIVLAATRAQAIERMQAVLAGTRIAGIETNREYLQEILAGAVFRDGRQTTQYLRDFAYRPSTVDVLEPGVQTTVQDWPGRLGYWQVGVPPSGPMDALAFRFANRLLGNDASRAALELTVSGPALRFNCDSTIAITGADMRAELDGNSLANWSSHVVPAGSVLRFRGLEGNGLRAYLAIAGGFDVPEYLGSKSTFTLGQFGGHAGRTLRVGDVLHIDAARPHPNPPPRAGEGVLNIEISSEGEGIKNINENSLPRLRGRAGVGADGVTDSASVGVNTPHPNPLPEGEGIGRSVLAEGVLNIESPSPAKRGRVGVGAGGVTDSASVKINAPNPLPEGKGTGRALSSAPSYPDHWPIGVLYGPHGAPDFFTSDDIETFFATDWEVHYNSSRTGVRLIGPKPQWARRDGGEAGLHPSNIHDNAYAIGAIDFTGDMPVILGPDGPSLGGFVCPAVVVQAELWKLGQLKPGNTIRFHPLTLAEADELERAQTRHIESLTLPRTSLPSRHIPPEPAEIERFMPRSGIEVVYRRSGDAYLLVEYGPPLLDFNLRFRVHALMQALDARQLAGVLDLTPGIRSLQVHVDAHVLPLARLRDELVAIERHLPAIDNMEVPARIVHLPLAWDDSQTRLAIEKYRQSVRNDAPWCPSNLEFIRRINGLDSIEDVKRIVFDASYMVLGLGDVYLGAPVATPVDPRHRLVTTKYNPARTWTPENAVGIGGAYLCVYGMEGPGGYQFVGRTLQMWNRYRATREFSQPWLLRFFDQIRFYPVSEEELLRIRRDFPLGRYSLRIEETTFRLREYNAFLHAQAGSIGAFKHSQQIAFNAERERWATSGQTLFESGTDLAPPADDGEALAPGVSEVVAHVAGNVWKIEAGEGERVKAGQVLLVIESMKMEIAVVAPGDGQVQRVACREGSGVAAGQRLMLLRAD